MPLCASDPRRVDRLTTRKDLRSKAVGLRARDPQPPLRSENQWSQVDFRAGIVRLEPGTTKDKEGRGFPFDALPALADLLKRQREATTRLERGLAASQCDTAKDGG